ncbi:hypothetical protein MAR_032911 [Mya arenaria]|uniref:Uncharacterized protein n=1 Tax=Mya arenaria TaxID=6604 RepID=A0ABY7GAJ8_MYAAR|nr:hypothetical protein MAR_032911 [Mya arenaria]
MSEDNQQKRVLLHGDGDIAAAVQLLSTEVNRLTTQNNQLATEVNRLTTQNNQLTTDVNRLTTQNNQLTNEVNELATEINQQQTNITNVATKNVEMGSKISQLETKNAQLETKIDQHTVDMTSLSSQQHGEQKDVFIVATFQGAVYVRWGRTTCPKNGTDLVYTGYAAGNYYNQEGAADYVCLTSEPIWGVYDDAAQRISAKMYGTEYQFAHQSYVDGGSQFFGKNLHDHDAPCAVCQTSRRSSVMIPGRNRCYPGWTKEYSGYLVAGLSGYSIQKSPTNYVCLDADAEYQTGDHVNNDGKVMNLVEAICGSLPCPPYDGQQKRVLLHGDGDIAEAVQLLTTEVNRLTTQNNQLATEINRLTTQNNQLTTEVNGLATEINQQKTNITNLCFYYFNSRYAAGNYYNQEGAADYVCLTSEPIWGAYDDTAQPISAKMYGTEYQFAHQSFVDGGAHFFGKHLHDHDAPCAVCQTYRRSSVMIPGRNQCYPGWTKEYAGYLVSDLSGYSDHKSSTNYACLDADAEYEIGDQVDNNGKLMYLVEAICGSLPCPPYVDYRDDEQVMPVVKDVIIHPNYTGVPNEHDIRDYDVAILDFGEDNSTQPPLNKFIKPICFPYRKVYNLSEGRLESLKVMAGEAYGFTVGWGLSPDSHTRQIFVLRSPVPDSCRGDIGGAYMAELSNFRYSAFGLAQMTYDCQDHLQFSIFLDLHHPSITEWALPILDRCNRLGSAEDEEKEAELERENDRNKTEEADLVENDVDGADHVEDNEPAG